MGSSVQGPELPPITLDTTLTELYKKASPQNISKKIVQVLCGVSCGIALSPDFPRNVKYIYQDGPFNTIPKKELNGENLQLQRSLAMKYLSLIPQRDAFISGNTKAVFFNIGQQTEHDRQEVERTLAILDPKQRPELVFCPGPSYIPNMDESSLVAYKLALDGLDAYPLTVPMDTHWYLNTKAALAQSGLPTPAAKIIETIGSVSPPDACCVQCQNADTIYILQNCTGVRGRWANEQVQRILDAIKTHPVPFVLKNQQSFAGAGTFVITSEKERQALLRDFEEEILPKLLSQVTSINYHLKPASIIISDMVEEPVGDYGLTFFASEDGMPMFLAVSEQMIDESKAWIGSLINYEHQEALKKKFDPIMREVAAFLHRHEYYGPVGADILETAPKTAKSAERTLHIVDLNVRTSGSLCLPLLRGHFTKRGMQCASSFSITVQGSRDDFLSQWHDQFEAGQMCILGWYEDPEVGQSVADVAIGGETDEKLRELIDRVRETTKEVTF